MIYKINKKGRKKEKERKLIKEKELNLKFLSSFFHHNVCKFRSFNLKIRFFKQTHSYYYFKRKKFTYRSDIHMKKRL